MPVILNDIMEQPEMVVDFQESPTELLLKVAQGGVKPCAHVCQPEEFKR